MVNIEVVRKDKTDIYECIAYKVRDSNYLYLYSTTATASPTSLKTIIPMQRADILEIKFDYE